MSNIDIRSIMNFAAKKGVSDIHFQVGVPPILRHNGQLIPIKHRVLNAEDTLYIGQLLTGIEDTETFKKDIKEYDGSFSLAGVARFRVNVFRQNNMYASVLRVIPFKIRDFIELNLPHIMKNISDYRRGLILVTGATGNGKSTTLAAMINHINQTRRAHLITIEDPIEFLFENDQAIISQREIGADTESFSSALRSALRQDPDIIMVGELRDLQTIDTCIKAVETGHLVMASIHTPDVMRTIGRLLSYFPSEEHATLRERLSENLAAVVSLRLIVSVEGYLMPATEVMLINKTIEMCIKNPDKTGEILKHVAKNREMGMQTFDQHLIDLVKSKMISTEMAKLAASKPEQIERALTLE